MGLFLSPVYEPAESGTKDIHHTPQHHGTMDPQSPGLKGFSRTYSQAAGLLKKLLLLHGLQTGFCLQKGTSQPLPGYSDTFVLTSNHSCSDDNEDIF